MKSALWSAGCIFLLCITSIAFIAGCGGGDQKSDGFWASCSDYTFLDRSAQCRTFSVPLDYTDPTGQAIDIFAFRYVGAGSEPKGQIWFLEGGPGGSGRLLSPAMLKVAKYYPDFDLYALDHRGVGMSTRLGCQGDNNFGDDWESYARCYAEISAKWGESLKTFSTTNAARDLHEVIEDSRENDKKVFIWGTSYGTYWLLRYLQIFPDRVDGVILDSICTPGECYLDRYDRWNDMVGGQFLDMCENDALCREKMTTIAGSPRLAMERIFQRVDNGKLAEGCNAMFTRKTLRNTLGQLLNNWSTRNLIPSLIYRLNRCSEADRKALNHFLRGQEAGSVDMTLLNSPMLCDLVGLSELFFGSSLAELGAFRDRAFFSEDASLRFARIHESGIWSTYQDGQYAQKLPRVEIPMLMLNGTTDPQTPLEIARKMGGHFTARHQHFVTVPFATHGVLINSPITPPNWIFGGEAQTCGSLLLGQFINAPQAPLDTSCTRNVYPVEFDGMSANNRLVSERVFGVANMWD